jgi:hypothetical protein
MRGVHSAPVISRTHISFCSHAQPASFSKVEPERKKVDGAAVVVGGGGYPEAVVRGEGVPRVAHEAGRAQARHVEVPPDVHLQLFI